MTAPGETFRQLLEPIIRAAIDPELDAEQRAKRIDAILSEWDSSPVEAPNLVLLPGAVPTEAGEWIRESEYFLGDPIPYRHGSWHLASIHVSTLKDATLYRTRCSVRQPLSERVSYRDRTTLEWADAPGPDDAVCVRCREIVAGTRKASLP